MKKVNETSRNQKFEKFKRFAEIPVVGDEICGKRDDVTRFYYENVNGLPIKAKWKYKRLKQIQSRLGIDVEAYVEVQVNW